MKKILLLCLSLLSYQLNFAQDFVREYDRKANRVLLRGRITFEDIFNESSCGWMKTGTGDYQPQRDKIDALSKIWNNYRFVVFAGTWCSDTKYLLPKFYKVLIEAGIDTRSVEMYGVNRKKESLDLEQVAHKVLFVPTIIVMRGNLEVGRIVESVKTNIESDLLEILQKDYAITEKERMNKFY